MIHPFLQGLILSFVREWLVANSHKFYHVGFQPRSDLCLDFNGTLHGGGPGHTDLIAGLGNG